MPDQDAAVVRAVLGGDTSAYAKLYDRYARLVRAICFDATGEFNQAQDLTQEVFFRAYRRLADLNDPSRFGRWLMGITRLVCREWSRSRLRFRSGYTRPNTISATALPPQSEDADFEALHKAITTLPRRERLAVHAFYLEGRSVEQARALLNLSRSGFYQVLQRARERLSRLLRDRCKDEP